MEGKCEIAQTNVDGSTMQLQWIVERAAQRIGVVGVRGLSSGDS